MNENIEDLYESEIEDEGVSEEFSLGISNADIMEGSYFVMRNGAECVNIVHDGVSELQMPADILYKTFMLLTPEQQAEIGIKVIVSACKGSPQH